MAFQPVNPSFVLGAALESADIESATTFGVSTATGQGKFFLFGCDECKTVLDENLAASQSDIEEVIGAERFTELSEQYYSYSDGYALYVDYVREVPQEDHSVGLCIGTEYNEYGVRGINCWTRDFVNGEYDNPQTFFFEALRIAPTRDSPDIIADGFATGCDGTDPNVGCFALEQPLSGKDGVTTWFPAVRLLPTTETVWKYIRENLEIEDSMNPEDKETFDVRWMPEEQLAVSSFIRQNGDVQWTFHGRYETSAATSIFNSAIAFALATTMAVIV